MKRIWADISDLDNPVKDGNFIEITKYTFYNETEISEKVNKGFIFPLLTFNGNLEFYGKMYRAVRDLIQEGEFFINIKVYEETDLAFSGRLSLRNTLNPANQTSSNELVAETIYDDLLREYDTEYNILNVTAIYKIASIEADRYEFMEDAIIDEPATNYDPIPNHIAYISGPLMSIPTLFGSTPSGASWVGNTDPTSKWSIYQLTLEPIQRLFEKTQTKFIRKFTREFRLELYIGNEIQNVPSDPWVFSENVTVDDILFAKFIKEVELFAPWFNSTIGTLQALPGITATIGQLFYKSNVFPPSSTIEDLYTRARTLTDTVKYMVNKADPSILFDETGDPPVNSIGGDSFSYLKTFTDSFFGINTIKNILLEQITDAILEDDGGGGLVEKEDKATIGLLTMGRLFSFFRDFMKLDWYLEKRGNDVYFMFRHESEQDKIVGITPQHNFKTFKNNNWSDGFLEYVHEDSDKFSRVKFEVPISLNADFLNQTGNFEQLKDTAKNEITVKTDYFHFDLEDSQIRRELYPEANNQFMMFATIPKDGDNLITGFTGFNVDSFNYAAGVLDVIIVPEPATGIVYSNGITDIGELSAGKTIKISFTVNTLTGHLNGLQIFIQEDTTILIDTISAGSGAYSYEYTVSDGFTSESPLSLRFVSPANTAGTYQISNIVLTAQKYEVIRGIGLKSNSQYMNSPLSIANLVENHWTYKLPANQFDFNGSVTTYANSRLIRDRNMVIIFVPIYKNGAFNFNQLIDTDAGEAEIIEAKHPMINGFAKIKLLLPQI